MNDNSYRKNPSSDLFKVAPDIVQNAPKPESWRAPYINLPLFTPSPSFSGGDVILDRYEVKKLWHGAMGDVYQCYDRYARCDIAMKTLISNPLLST